MDTRRELYKKFQEAFPLESLPEMTIEKYSNLNRSDSFCYWLESKTEELGSIWGGNSFKFGIYEYINKPTVVHVLTDEKYAWHKWYGIDNAKDAYNFFYPQLFVSQILHEKVISKLLTTKQHWEKFINGKLHFFTLKKNWFPFTKRKCSMT